MVLEVSMMVAIALLAVVAAYLGVMVSRLSERIAHVYEETQSLIAVSFRVVDEELATVVAHLKNPEKSRRINQRYAVEIPARVEQEQRVYVGSIRNISANGLFFETDLAATLSGVISVLLPDPVSGQEVRISGRVVHTLSREKAAERGVKPGVGVEVTDDPSRVLSQTILHASMKAQGLSGAELPIVPVHQGKPGQQARAALLPLRNPLHELQPSAS